MSDEICVKRHERYPEDRFFPDQYGRYRQQNPDVHHEEVELDERMGLGVRYLHTRSLQEAK